MRYYIDLFLLQCKSKLSYYGDIRSNDQDSYAKTLQENTENNSKEIDQQDETITELEKNNHSNTTVVILLPSFHNNSILSRS